MRIVCVHVCVCVCACMRMRACVPACMPACMLACVYERFQVALPYDAEAGISSKVLLFDVTIGYDKHLHPHA